MNHTVIGDCRETMRRLIADGARVQMCVTSPPYWGLRDYGTPPVTWADGWVGSFGLEPTVQMYVEHSVEVFRFVRELLADDGTLWLNLGDCYSNSDKGGYQSSRVTAEDSMQRSNLASDFVGAPNRQPQAGLKPKDLVLMPARVALALQADGWYLRQDIIWHKPNPMPESVTDRCTKAHEYLFLLSKSERYYFDAEAISEACSNNTHERYAQAKGKSFGTSNWGRADEPRTAVELSRRKLAEEGSGTKNNGSFDRAMAKMPERRNRRSVWTITSEPYPEAHFATFPPALIEPCILAGSRVGDIVLDPFMGSGTTGRVAQDLGRQWIGCELNPAYVDLERKRTAQQGMQL